MTNIQNRYMTIIQGTVTLNLLSQYIEGIEAQITIGFKQAKKKDKHSNLQYDKPNHDNSTSIH